MLNVEKVLTQGISPKIFNKAIDFGFETISLG